MTLLRSYGCPLYDRGGNFTVNTPEGIRSPGLDQGDGREGLYPRARRIWSCWTA